VVEKSEVGCGVEPLVKRGAEKSEYEGLVKLLLLETVGEVSVWGDCWGEVGVCGEWDGDTEWALLYWGNSVAIGLIVIVLLLPITPASLLNIEDLILEIVLLVVFTFVRVEVVNGVDGGVVVCFSIWTEEVLGGVGIISLGFVVLKCVVSWL